MIGEYKGHYIYDNPNITMNAPDQIGIYYMGTLNSDGKLGVLYVGRAKGEDVSVKSRLLNHLSNGEWPDITHFGYKTCSTELEAENLEKAEIVRLEIPKYNKKIG